MLKFSRPLVEKPFVPLDCVHACGLSNLGNTCYANSTLQALRFCSKFLSYVRVHICEVQSVCSSGLIIKDKLRQDETASDRLAHVLHTVSKAHPCLFNRVSVSIAHFFSRMAWPRITCNHPRLIKEWTVSSQSMGRLVPAPRPPFHALSLSAL